MLQKTKWLKIRFGAAGVTAVLLLTALLALLDFASPQTVAAAGFAEFGYGFNVAVWDTTKLQGLGFNSIKLFDPPGSRLPLNVLLRVDANASHLGDLERFGNEIGALAASQKGYVEAYEIGNEPNLDATYGWGYDDANSWGGMALVPPNADDYVTLLCRAYQRIKSADPDALVVSAGLAPTGRVSGFWQGHSGHNGLYQDERAFLQEMLAAGGAQCFDVLGYHPYGYSAEFDVAPDQFSSNPAQNCVNGFCFRGAEKIYEILQIYGYGNKEVWATEFGWITPPPTACLSTPGWQDRAWQIVSEEKQAENLTGAFAYASSNWPWMGAMFVFNLNFNSAPWISDPCEQMRFYGVDGRPAETALGDMPKISGPARGDLAVTPLQFTYILTPSLLPLDTESTIIFENTGIQPLQYTVTINDSVEISLQLIGDSSETVAAGETKVDGLQVVSSPSVTGTYLATLTIETSSLGIVESIMVPIQVHLWAQKYEIYLPMLRGP